MISAAAFARHCDDLLAAVAPGKPAAWYAATFGAWRVALGTREDVTDDDLRDAGADMASELEAVPTVATWLKHVNDVVHLRSRADRRVVGVLPAPSPGVIVATGGKLRVVVSGRWDRVAAHATLVNRGHRGTTGEVDQELRDMARHAEIGDNPLRRRPYARVRLRGTLAAALGCRLDHEVGA